MSQIPCTLHEQNTTLLQFSASAWAKGKSGSPAAFPELVSSFQCPSILLNTVSQLDLAEGNSAQSIVKQTLPASK